MFFLEANDLVNLSDWVVLRFFPQYLNTEPLDARGAVTSILIM